MKIQVYSAYDFIIPYLEAANKGKHELQFTKQALSEVSVNLAKGCDAISIFSGDDASARVLKKLSVMGVNAIALRATGYDCVDLEVAKMLNISVANVPEYSPYAIAEHAMALLLAINRKLIISNDRIRKNNFCIDGLTGFDLNGKTIGIIGTGKIGSVMARICKGMGCKLIGYDIEVNETLKRETGIVYENLTKLCKQADVISLHVPLNKKTHHLINAKMIQAMKPGVLIINTARGGVVDSKAILAGLKSEKIGGLGMDVYEFEKPYFFQDHSNKPLEDTILQTLISMPNVLITSHHAFLTSEALTNISMATIQAFDYWQKGKPAPHELFPIANKKILNPLK
ncbi:2-hydroxyacid dehydrogenase [Ascidiimonas sp. W6]|uniref:2-hydroxyacid dehydrogenase n=1 Tax=Ascidiimonas meishanensis TaxID=3128903 RepID=UPI0030ED1125